MLFRIEDTQNIDGNSRVYSLPKEQLPLLTLGDLNVYIANEVRKEINNTNDRKLLSYSKSLGVCLLKYNKYTDNELHIVNDANINFLCYYNFEQGTYESCWLDIYNGVCIDTQQHSKKQVLLCNFALDVSENYQLDEYLRRYTNIGKKKLASPEKDKEVVLMQVPNDFYISEYTDAVYLLYALVLKYGMCDAIYYHLKNKISKLEDFRFSCCNETEREAILMVLRYLFYNQQAERCVFQQLLVDIEKDDTISCYYDPIMQLRGIQEDSFEESYMLSDYNDNIISSWIWEYYGRVYG